MIMIVVYIHTNLVTLAHPICLSLILKLEIQYMAIQHFSHHSNMVVVVIARIRPEKSGEAKILEDMTIHTPNKTNRNIKAIR